MNIDREEIEETIAGLMYRDNSDAIERVMNTIDLYASQQADQIIGQLIRKGRISEVNPDDYAQEKVNEEKEKMSTYLHNQMKR